MVLPYRGSLRSVRLKYFVPSDLIEDSKWLKGFGPEK